MTCRDGACETQSAVRPVARQVSEERRKEVWVFCHFMLDLCVKAGDDEGARRWQVEINRIEGKEPSRELASC